jgi:hypothetical protein
MSPGTATITVTTDCGGHTDTVVVTVVPAGNYDGMVYMSMTAVGVEDTNFVDVTINIDENPGIFAGGLFLDPGNANVLARSWRHTTEGYIKGPSAAPVGPHTFEPQPIPPAFDLPHISIDVALHPTLAINPPTTAGRFVTVRFEVPDDVNRVTFSLRRTSMAGGPPWALVQLGVTAEDVVWERDTDPGFVPVEEINKTSATTGTA